MSQKNMYLTDTLSQEAPGGCSPPKQRNKQRKRKTWGLENKVSNTREICVQCDGEGRAQGQNCAVGPSSN